MFNLAKRMGRSELYIVSDQTNAAAIPLVNDAIAGLAALCRASPWELECFESGARRATLVCYGEESSSSVDWNPLSAGTLPVVVPSGGVGSLAHGLRRVLELRLKAEPRLPDVLIFASSRSFESIKPWLHSLAQFEWGWMSIYLLDEGAESAAKALLESVYAEVHAITGNGRVIPAEEFRRLSGDLSSTIDFGWYMESPLVSPVVPPKGAVWVAREGAMIAKGITPEALRFLLKEAIFKPTDHYWKQGMAAWGLLAQHS